MAKESIAGTVHRLLVVLVAAVAVTGMACHSMKGFHVRNGLPSAIDVGLGSPRSDSSSPFEEWDRHLDSLIIGDVDEGDYFKFREHLPPGGTKLLVTPADRELLVVARDSSSHVVVFKRWYSEREQGQIETLEIIDMR